MCLCCRENGESKQPRAAYWLCSGAGGMRTAHALEERTGGTARFPPFVVRHFYWFLSIIFSLQISQFEIICKYAIIVHAFGTQISWTILKKRTVNILVCVLDNKAEKEIEIRPGLSVTDDCFLQGQLLTCPCGSTATRFTHMDTFDVFNLILTINYLRDCASDTWASRTIGWK